VHTLLEYKNSCKELITTGHANKIWLHIIDAVEEARGDNVAALNFMRSIGSSLPLSQNGIVLLLFNIDTCQDKNFVEKINASKSYDKNWRTHLDDFFHTNVADDLVSYFTAAFIEK